MKWTIEITKKNFFAEIPPQTFLKIITPADGYPWRAYWKKLYGTVWKPNIAGDENRTGHFYSALTEKERADSELRRMLFKQQFP